MFGALVLMNVNNPVSGPQGCLDSNNQHQTTPALLPIENISAISAGESHSLFLDCNQQVYTCGDSSCGKLGLSEFNVLNQNGLPLTLISSLEGIIGVSAGDSHSLFLGTNGHVFSCGHNSCGELGLNDRRFRKIPTMIPGLKNIVSLYAGYDYSICLDREGCADIRR